MSTNNELNSTMQTLPAEEGSTVPAVSTEPGNGAQSPETTEGVSDAGQSQAGASVGEGQAGASVGQGQAGASVGKGQAGASVGQGQAGASVGQGQAGASAQQVEGGAEEELRRHVRRHADLSFTSCFERGCRFHQGAKDMARYWPEDYVGNRRRGTRNTTRQPRGNQQGNW